MLKVCNNPRQTNFVREFLANLQNNSYVAAKEETKFTDKISIIQGDEDGIMDILDGNTYYSLINLTDEKFKQFLRKLRNVTQLNCSNANISNLSQYLPLNLRTLNCTKCPITSIDNILPGALTILDCSGCKLRKLTTLPPSLITLICDDNQCEILSGLPDGLQKLSCRNNKLQKIQYIPTSLKELDCYNNNLTYLGFLSTGLIKIDCRKNQLGFGTLYDVTYTNSSSQNAKNKFYEQTDDEKINKKALMLFLRKHALIYSLKNLNIDSNLCFIGIPAEIINLIISEKAVEINPKKSSKIKNTDFSVDKMEKDLENQRLAEAYQTKSCDIDVGLFE